MANVKRINLDELLTLLQALYVKRVLVQQEVVNAHCSYTSFIAVDHYIVTGNYDSFEEIVHFH